MDDSTTIGELKEMCRRFIYARDWERDELKDLTLAMSIEVAEILEHLRFKSDVEIREYLQDPANFREIGLEVADVFYFIMTICLQINLDLSSAYKDKMAINEQHYPAHLAKGSNKKWTHYLSEGAATTEQIGLGETGKEERKQWQSRLESTNPYRRTRLSLASICAMCVPASA